MILYRSTTIILIIWFSFWYIGIINLDSCLDKKNIVNHSNICLDKFIKFKVIQIIIGIMVVFLESKFE